MRRHKGDTVTMNSKALENYGEKWRDVELTVTHAAHSYMPASQFFAQGKPEGFHPGYDEGMKGQGLYDLENNETGEALGFSLYDWELKLSRQSRL